MSETLPPARLPWTDPQGLPLKAIFRWAEGVQRAIGTPPEEGATGTARNYDVGTQGDKIPLTSGANLWSGQQIYTLPPKSLTGYKVNNTQVVGAQGAAVAAAVHSAAAPTQAEFNAAVDQLNAALARLRAHGLIAT